MKKSRDVNFCKLKRMTAEASHEPHELRTLEMQLSADNSKLRDSRQALADPGGRPKKDDQSCPLEVELALNTCSNDIKIFN